MSYKKCFIVLVIISSILSSLFPSLAVAQRFYVQGYDVSGHYWGVYGWNYVMVNPTIANQHVSALGATRVDNNAWVEVGWFASTTTNNRQPRFFYAWFRDALLCGGEDYREVLLNYPQAGTEHRYNAHWQNSPNNEWHFLIDGVLRGIVSVPEPCGLTNAWVIGNSERISLNDTNFSRFWYLQRADQFQNWSWWGNLQPRPGYNNDPQYEFIRDSDTAFRSLNVGR